MLNRQQPFGADVISRISAIDDRSRRARDAPLARARDARRARGRGLRRRRASSRDEVYEIVVTGNVTMLQIALGIDPEPLSMAPFIVAARELPPTRRAADFGVDVHPRAPAVTFPALGAYVGPRHRRRAARDRAHARPPAPPLHRRRHELRDRPRLLATGRSPRPPPPGRRSRRRRSAAACGPPRARSRA